jgi:hypothetical protein
MAGQNALQKGIATRHIHSRVPKTKNLISISTFSASIVHLPLCIGGVEAK